MKSFLKQIVTFSTLLLNTNIYADTTQNPTTEHVLVTINKQIEFIENNIESYIDIDTEKVKKEVDLNSLNLNELNSIQRELNAIISKDGGTVCVC